MDELEIMVEIHPNRRNMSERNEEKLLRKNAFMHKSTTRKQSSLEPRLSMQCSTFPLPDYFTLKTGEIYASVKWFLKRFPPDNPPK
jgi:hypothetical protein